MASDLISRSAAIACLGNSPSQICMPWSEVERMLRELPAVDAAPVVHARWILIQNGSGVCSACNRSDHIDSLAAYCRYCGARMDGGDENATNRR